MKHVSHYYYYNYYLLLLLIILVLGTLHVFSKIENKSTERQWPREGLDWGHEGPRLQRNPHAFSLCSPKAGSNPTEDQFKKYTAHPLSWRWQFKNLYYLKTSFPFRTLWFWCPARFVSHGFPGKCKMSFFFFFWTAKSIPIIIITISRLCLQNTKSLRLTYAD